MRARLTRVVVAAMAATLVAGAQTPSSEPITIGERVQIHSRVLGESRPLIVAKPANYHQETDRYIVLYLLDGEEHFVHTAGIVSFLARTGRIPPLLLVAIPNTNRSRDLTPPTSDEIDKRFTPDNGGADRFLRFLREELIPYVDRTYRTRPYRILAGHSFGGLFALHALTARPQLFQACIAISPSLFWNKRAIVARAEAYFNSSLPAAADLYMTSADEGGLDAYQALVAVFEKKARPEFRWRYEPMLEETHISVSHQSIYRGLDALFDGWHLVDPMGTYEKGGLEAVHRHFREGARKFGYDRTTPPFTVSLIVARLLRTDRLDAAAAVLMHDPVAYPPPWNQLDAVAAAYARRGEKEQAIRFYTLSIRANPANENAKRRLKALGAQ